jgi:4-hydroxythreonine-4-phosphate dehydrogenase
MPISRSARRGFANCRIGVTLGDPAGIGPEIALKALTQFKKKSSAEIILVGPEPFYSELAKQLKLNLFFTRHSEPRRGEESKAKILRCAQDDELNFSFKRIFYGRSDNALTRAAVRSIEMGVALAMRGAVDAIVTPPINKAGLKKAGFDIPGHTEYLAKLSKTNKYEMMLVGGPLRVVLVTRHTAIKDVPKKITRRRVEETILMADRELRRSFGIKRPRLVVCGLNPHAGESGTIGLEEIREIIPAVKNAQKKTNAVITGPLSPDALFVDAYRGRYDAEICMYHDQGLIPLKMISRGAGVNVTLGLPFVRTSPDHGTAYDIAGQFKADPGSMLEALTLAEMIVKNRRRRHVSG